MADNSLSWADKNLTSKHNLSVILKRPDLIDHVQIGCKVERVTFWSWKGFYLRFPFLMPVSEMIPLCQF